MLAALSDHHSFGSSRKSLLIASCLVILISAAKIEGETVQLLGLDLAFSKPNLVFLLRIVSAYLLWVFFWISITEYYPQVKLALIESRQKVIESSLQETKRIEHEMYSRDEEDHGYHEPDGWWEAHYEIEVKKKDEIARFEKIEQLLVIGRLIVVDVLPVTILALFAVVAPGYLASLIVL